MKTLLTLGLYRSEEPMGWVDVILVAFIYAIIVFAFIVGGAA